MTMENKNCITGKLDSVTMPLAGITLIEAAAGTGKTYNIQNIAARLIVEKNFPVETLVIVTFTEKAVQELSDRIRSMLELLLGVIKSRSNFPVHEVTRAKALLERFTASGISAEEQKERLENALRDIDKCRIATIHGFCFRLLSEYAFESSTTFHAQLEKDIASITGKMLKDFCRFKRYSQVDLPGWEDLSPGKLEKAVNFLLNRPNIKQIYKRQVFENENAIIQYLHGLQEEFANLPNKIDDINLLRDKVNKICSTDPEIYIDKAISVLKDLKNVAASDWQRWYDVMSLFRPARFLNKGKAARKKSDADYREFVYDYVSRKELFAVAEEYCMVIENDCNTFLIKDAVNFISKNLEIWKQKNNILDYDDLLLKAEQALRNKSFRRFVQQKLNAGIIDEFQDTDPVQYNIFKAIFIDRSDRRYLFMVGDPRQAIYAFRGGDIATYIAARKECIEKQGNIYTLTTNFRSSGRMIDAFNTVFKHNDPFFSDEIAFEHVEKPSDIRPGIQLNGQEMEFPLSAQYYENDNEDIFALSASEINRMLTCGKFTIPDGNGSYRPVTPGDIAVLAENNRNLESFRDYLARYNIPVIGERKGGLWSSVEAVELARVMHAVLENNDAALVREALLTTAGGVTLMDLDLENPAAAEKMLAWRMDFINLADCWYQKGTAAFIAMLIKIFSLKERLTGIAGGDRTLSNYIQMGDLLAAAELANKLPPRGVLKFLQEKIAAGGSDEMEMLESDRSAVHLLTIHKSKGLQFPIVFLIDLDSRRAMAQSSYLSSYHDNGELCCNVDKLDEKSILLAGLEDMQELMRLIYVAVTRACYFCRINWGKSRNMERAMPMTWLFARQNAIQDDEYRKNFILGNIAFAPGDMNIPENLQQKSLFRNYPDGEYYPLLDADLVEPETITAPAGRRYIISYSALNELGHQTDVESDHDFTDRDSGDEENSLPPAPEKETSDRLTGGIWDIPPGAAIGNAWHEILENTDFTRGVSDDLLKNTMANYGFKNPEHIAASAEMFKNLLDCTLPCGMKLKELSMERRLTELEFLLSSPQGFTFGNITSAINEYMASEFGSVIAPKGVLNMHRGFFTGFIDMVFEYNNKLYIVDWKSNALGSLKESFYGSKLKHHMFKSLYPLQYLCYLAALLKYLEQRLQRKVDEELYNEYIGGVYYIFLRGMMLDEPGGVFAANVPYRFVRSLADVITCGKGE